MLRRTVKRSQKDSGGQETNKLRKKNAEQRPLGSKDSKDTDEHKLEAFVLGKDEDIIEKLNQTDKVYSRLSLHSF